jgi:hypothetical protein
VRAVEWTTGRGGVVEKVLGGDGGVVEEAEATGQVPLGVVAWRPAHCVHHLVLL